MTRSGMGLLRNGTAARAALLAVLAATLAACGSTPAKNDTFALSSVAAV